MSQAQIVRVALGARSYDVHVGAGLIARAGELIAPIAHGRRVYVVTDENVARLHGHTLMRSLHDAEFPTAFMIETPPGETSKSFAGLERICSSLLKLGIERKDLVVAFGGGVVGDLAGFAAGVVKRGVEFVQIPTTLLAQVDSSVGGKTGIDTPEGKNLVGLFHQPRLVLADLDVLRTLPEREMRAGYAEVVKYGLIDDAAFFAWCEANWARVLACEAQALAKAVSHCVGAKARIVAGDERESGARALLNLGHTFAHALETLAGYDGALLHGEAVAAGMGLAFDLSAELGVCSRQEADRVIAHLAAAGFELKLAALPRAPYNLDAFMEAMMHDKKAEAGALTLILARGVGGAFIQKRAQSKFVRDFLGARLVGL